MRNYIALYQGDVENRDSIVGFANKPLWGKLGEKTKERIYKVLFVRMTDAEICYLEDYGEEDKDGLGREIYHRISESPNTLIMN